MVNLLCHLDWAIVWSGVGLYVIFGVCDSVPGMRLTSESTD